MASFVKLCNSGEGENGDAMSKEVFCPQGHLVGEIGHRKNGRAYFFASNVRIESTERGFLAWCVVCDQPLREWKVSMVGLVEKVVQDGVADLLYQFKIELLMELREGQVVMEELTDNHVNLHT